MLNQKNQSTKNGNMNLFKKLLIVIFVFSLSISTSYAVDDQNKNPVSGSAKTKVYKRAADTANKQLRDAGFVKGWNKDKNGKEFFIAIGNGVVSINNNSSEIHTFRQMAFVSAMQDLKKNFVDAMGKSFQSRIEKSISNTSPDALKAEVDKAATQVVGTNSNELDKIRKLINSKLDNALKKEGYDPTAADAVKKEKAIKVLRSQEINNYINVMATHMITGLEAWDVFEESQTGKNATIVVIGKYDPLRKKVANAIITNNLSSLPNLKDFGKPLNEWVPMNGNEKDDEDLIFQFGSKMIVDEQGNIGVVGYGHASPTQTQQEAGPNFDSFVDDACKNADMLADQAIATFAKENVFYTRNLGLSDKSQNFERDGQKLYKAVLESKSEEVVKSDVTLENFRTTPVYEKALQSVFHGDALDCVAVRYWSPSGVKASIKLENEMKDVSSESSGGSSGESSQGNTESYQKKGRAGSKDF
jgi:hypothetical protein